MEIIQEIPTQVQDWGEQLIHCADEWKKSRGSGIRIGVLDTGCATHPDLPVYTCGGSVGANCGDVNGHGTHVTGIINAIDNGVGVVGVAPGAEVIQFSGFGEARSVWDITHLLDTVLNFHCDILNISGGLWTDIPELHTALRAIYADDTIIVAATGNAGWNTEAYPATYPECLAVTSYDKNLHSASDCSWKDGMQGAVAMPGVDILSTWLDNQYARQSGTSEAAPMMTGLIALMLAAEPVFIPRHERHDWLHGMLAGIASVNTDFTYKGIESPVVGKHQMVTF